jgi:hypothetical protein
MPLVGHAVANQDELATVLAGRGPVDRLATARW